MQTITFPVESLATGATHAGFLDSHGRWWMDTMVAFADFSKPIAALDCCWGRIRRIVPEGEIDRVITAHRPAITLAKMQTLVLLNGHATVEVLPVAMPPEVLP